MKAATITIDGKAIGFVARETAEGCKDCLFKNRRFEDCKRAEVAAREAGQPDCEDAPVAGGSFIYVEADPRQLVLDEEVLP